MAITCLILMVIVLYPLGKILYQSLLYDGSLSLQNYIDILTDEGFFTSLKNSLFVSIVSMLISVVIGTFFAWVVARTDIPGKRFFRTAFVVPFIVPPFIGALAWMQLLGPVGLLNTLYKSLFGTEELLWNIYGADGIILVLTLHLFPLVYINMLGSLERMNPELEEAAQVSGSRIFSVMRRITLPLMLPALASGAVLVFIMAIANFGIPAILGFSDNYYVVTTKIYEAVTRSTSANGLAAAAATSTLLGIVAAGGLLFQRLYIKKREFAVLSGKSIQPNVAKLGRHRLWILPLSVLMVFATSIAPLTAILLTSLTDIYGLAPVPGNWTLNNFVEVFTGNSAVRRAIRNSLVLGFSAATIISILGSLISYIIVKTKLRGRYALEIISNMPYALPGTVVAVGMILAWLRPIPAVGFSLYNTIWILLVAYIARYLAFGVRTTTSSLSQIHTSLEEAARISGASWSRTYRDIIIPLILPGLFAGWFMVFIPCIRELTISSLLWSTRHETIGVMVFNLQESGNTVASAALSVILILVLLTANLVTRRLTGGKAGY
jgi:iron(III) transport system permease protein